jgi:hypothetical protein
MLLTLSHTSGGTFREVYIMPSNGYDRAQLEALLGEIDDADSRLASLKGEYMQACKGPRDDISTVFERAREAGIAIRAFRTLVKNRRLDHKAKANIDRLEDDDRAEYGQLAEAFGDTPFGQYAARRANPQQEAAVDSFA